MLWESDTNYMPKTHLFTPAIANLKNNRNIYPIHDIHKYIRINKTLARPKRFKYKTSYHDKLHVIYIITLMGKIEGRRRRW